MPDYSLHLLASEGAHAAPDVAMWKTMLFGALLLSMIVCLALEEKIHAKKSLIVGAHAITVLLLGGLLLPLPFGPVVNALGHELNIPIYITAVEWEIIAIIVGSTLFVTVTSKSGLFSWMAIRLTKLSGGDPLLLLWFYGVMTVAFSAVLNNVTAMIIVGSLTGVSLQKLGRQNLLLGFLLVEGLLTNIGGLLTLISSVPNIILGTTAGISFIEFFVKASPYVVLATAATVIMGAKVFRIRSLSGQDERAEAALLVSGFDENDGVESRRFFVFSALMLGAFVAVIATTSLIPVIRELGMGFVALAFGGVMLVRYKHEVQKFYQALDWDLLAFFTTLFVVINVMEHAQVLALIGAGLEHLIGLGETTGSAAVLLSSAVASSVTDNIPLAAMLAKIMAGIPSIDRDSPFWWAVIFGSNLGGNLTPIGSASTLVAVTIIHRYGIKLTFGQFVMKALPFAAVHVALAVAYVLVVV